MNEIVIRKGNIKEAGRIYDLLAAEGQQQSMEFIERWIDCYTVLLHDNQIAAVHCSRQGESHAGATVIVHPGYPEGIIASSMCDMLQGIAQRQAALNCSLDYVKYDTAACKSINTQNLLPCR